MLNEHYGKLCRANIGGVDVDLIMVEYPVFNKPRVARCIDRTGTRYTVQIARLIGDGSKENPDEILNIIASAAVRNNPKFQLKGGK